MNEEQQYDLYEKEFNKLTDSSRKIRIDDPNLTPLENKAAILVHCCDFDVYEIEWQGIKGYILFDCQYGEYRGENWTCDVDKFLEQCSVRELKDVISLIGEAFYEDYGFDIAKVYDESILDFTQCYVDDEEEEEECSFSKEQLQDFADEIGYTSVGNIHGDFIALLAFARKMAQKETIK